MIPQPQDILNKLTASVNDCTALFHHCLQAVQPHTDAGIEASFLQLVKSWEAFLEDTTLILLCGQTPLTGTPIIPKFVLNNIEDARQILYNGQQYTDWIKVNILLVRFRTFFETNKQDSNRIVEAILKAQTTFKDLVIIRNEIAHSSFSTKNKIEIFYRDFNPIKKLNRPAEYLKDFSKESPNDHNFKTYTSTIQLIANEIIG